MTEALNSAFFFSVTSTLNIFRQTKPFIKLSFLLSAIQVKFLHTCNYPDIKGQKYYAVAGARVPSIRKLPSLVSHSIRRQRT